MPNKKKSDYAPHIAPEDAPFCHIEGCGEPGLYKAPKSRSDLADYHWLCLEHIREHNQKWDFFSGMEAGDIESFMKDAVLGHRPTWTRESHIRQGYQRLQEALYDFLNAGVSRPRSRSPHLTPRLRKALAALEMIDYPYTLPQLKAQYHKMVKQYHPDANKGDKKLEERFKHITAAYRYLVDHGKNQ